MGFWGNVWKGAKAVVGDAENAVDRTNNQFRDVKQDEFFDPNDPTGKTRASQLQNYALNSYLRLAPQADDSGFRANQNALVDQLQRQSLGQDSLSALQLRQGADRNIAQQQALAASAHPGMGALAARMAMQNAGRINSGLSGQQAMAGIAERQASANALSGLLQGARQQDFNLASFNANAQMQTRGQNDTQLAEMLRLQQANNEMQQQNRLAYQNARTSRYGATLGVPTGTENLIRSIAEAGSAYASSGGGKK